MTLLSAALVLLLTQSPSPGASRNAPAAQSTRDTSVSEIDLQLDMIPPEAAVEHVQGVVVIDIAIDESGSAANGHVVRSIPLIDKAALREVSVWKFEPNRLNGRPISVMMTVTVNYALQEP